MRASKDKWYLDIAEQVALRSTCIRRYYGAVIVKEDEILSTGYTGAPRQTINCCDIGFCYRDRIGVRRGENYELCRSVHAEQNAIIQARRLDMIGSTLYLVGLDIDTKERLLDAEPCRICKRTILNAGIKKVIVGISEDEQRVFLMEEWVKNNLHEFDYRKGEEPEFLPKPPPISFSDPIDEQRSSLLRSKYSLAEAIVVQTTSFENRKLTVGREAARYFSANVRNGNSVALSCGDTILALLETLPPQTHKELVINQLSIEGDPKMIHQAPATLVGMLRGKCSPHSRVYGLQLPPPDLTPSSIKLREEIANSKFIKNLRKEVIGSDIVFIGVGSADIHSASFWAVAQAATGNKFLNYSERMEIVGEINNQVFDKSGNNCTEKIPGLSNHLINILSLDDIREMARDFKKHKIVMVATGPEKAKSIEVALRAGFANLIITGRDDADRLLDH